MHLKYVYDLPFAKSFNLKENLNFVPESIRSLPFEESQVYKQLLKIEEYFDTIAMNINKRKTK